MLTSFSKLLTCRHFSLIPSRRNQIKSNRLPSFDLAWQSAVRLAFIFRENWARPSLPTKPHNEKHDGTSHCFLLNVLSNYLLMFCVSHAFCEGCQGSRPDVTERSPTPAVSMTHQAILLVQKNSWSHARTRTRTHTHTNTHTHTHKGKEIMEILDVKPGPHVGINTSPILCVINPPK